MANSGSITELKCRPSLYLGADWEITSINTTSRTASLTVKPYFRCGNVQVGDLGSSKVTVGSTSKSFKMDAKSSDRDYNTKKYGSSVTYSISYDDDGNWSNTISVYWHVVIQSWSGESGNWGPFTTSGTATATNIGKKQTSVTLSTPTVSVGASVTQGSSFTATVGSVSNASSYT